MTFRIVPVICGLALVLAGALGLKAGGEAIIAQYAQAEATASTERDGVDEELALAAAGADTGPEVEPVSGFENAPNQAPKAVAENGRVVEAPPVEQGGYERIAPRAPLSSLGVARPPKPKATPMPETWKYTRLFNPVATSAGIVEAQGYRVALAGVEPLPVDEQCAWQGVNWPCGARARTAFRAWLRARAVQCKVPPDPERDLITAACQIGKEDVAEWLVTSGWVRALANGPYAGMGKKAEDSNKGIFGAPPKRVTTIWTPPLSVMDASTEGAGETEPPALAEPSAVFPPAPEPPQ